MSSPALSGRVYRFGVFEVDLSKRELLRRGSPVRLQDQPFRVLCMLLEKPGEAVAREDLRQALWPSDTYVEFDGSLNAALKRLRFALGDSARNPTFIETLPKHGYRFIAPVSVQDCAHPGQAEASQPRLPAPSNGKAVMDRNTQARRPRRWVYLAIPCAAAMLVQQIVYWLFPLPPPRMINRTRLTHVGNVNPGPIVSDGTHIYFCARRGARHFPMQTSVQGGDTVELKTPFENSTIYDISPNGTNFLVGSFGRIGDEAKLWIWPVQGGTPRRPFGDIHCKDAAWSRDARLMAYSSNGSVYVVNSDGSAPRLLANKDAYGIVWSRDNSNIRFSTWDAALQVHSGWEIGADGTRLHQVFPGNEKVADTASGFWLDDGKYFAFLRWTPSGPKIWMVRERPSLWRRSSPRAFFVATGAEDTETVASLGPNGSRLISVGYWPDSKLQRLSADAHSLSTASVFPSAGNLHFSRDGRWVAYVSTVDGALWRCRPDGRDCLQLTFSPVAALEPRWSPDSAEILFVDVHPNAIRRLRVVAAQGSSPARTVGPPDLVAGTADWSPDGKRIVMDMSSASPAAPDRLYFIDAATGKTTVLAGSEGFNTPAWSRDGRLIAVLNSGGTRIHFYSLKENKWTPGPAGTRLSYHYWSYRSGQLFYQDSGEPGQPIYRFNPATGKRQLSFSFEEALRKDAITCRFAGIGLDDTLYAHVIAATADLFAVDLDLP